jgi:cytochrome c-type biogenesis protein CcmH
VTLRGRRVLLAGCVIAAIVALLVAWSREGSDRVPLQDRVQAVASTIRCPVCQDLTVADSPSGLAHEMRLAIAEDLRRGMTPDQIRASFHRAYGDRIRLDPPKRGLALLAWIAPIIILLAAAVGLVRIVRRLTGRSHHRVSEVVR